MCCVRNFEIFVDCYNEYVYINLDVSIFMCLVAVLQVSVLTYGESLSVADLVIDVLLVC